MIQTRSASTALNKHKALQQFFKWLMVDEEEIDQTPMVRVRQPRTPIPTVGGFPQVTGPWEPSSRVLIVDPDSVCRSLDPLTRVVWGFDRLATPGNCRSRRVRRPPFLGRITWSAP
jgi:hypothetical protein